GRCLQRRRIRLVREHEERRILLVDLLLDQLDLGLGRRSDETAGLLRKRRALEAVGRSWHRSDPALPVARSARTRDAGVRHRVVRLRRLLEVGPEAPNVAPDT